MGNNEGPEGHVIPIVENRRPRGLRIRDVSPHIALTHGPQDGGPVLTLDDTLMLLPTNKDVGINNQVALGAGYAWERLAVTVGALLAAYRIPACGRALCGVVVGVAPGGFAQLNVFLQGIFGISVRGNVAWYAGQSLVLSNELTWSVAAGPLLRWR